MERRLYAVWGGDGSLPPGVYCRNWQEELRYKVEGTGMQYKRVSSREEGLKLLQDEDRVAFRRLLYKAQLTHHRCWYCARPLDPASIGDDDSTELEHLVPRSSGWLHADRDENLVAACRRCNNPKHPGKGERDVPAFRALLQKHHQARRIAFYGEVLAWVRSNGATLGFPAPLAEEHARLVLQWYARSGGLHLHNWRDEDPLRDYRSGLLLPIPPDAPPYALGAPHRLPTPPSWPYHA